jgi:hypothetical protein
MHSLTLLAISAAVVGHVAPPVLCGRADQQLQKDIS